MADINDLLAILGGKQVQNQQPQNNMQDRIAKMVELGKQQAQQAQQRASQQTANNVPLAPAGVGGTVEDAASYLASAQRSPEEKKAFTDNIQNASKPMVVEGNGGKFLTYANGQTKFIPDLNKATIQAGDVQAPITYQSNPLGDGKPTVQTLLPNAQGQPQAPQNNSPMALNDPLQSGTVGGMINTSQDNREKVIQRNAAAEALGKNTAGSIEGSNKEAIGAVNAQQGLDALSNILTNAEMAKLPIGIGSKEYKELLSKANTAFQIAGLPQISPDALGQTDLYSAITANLITGLKGTDGQVAKALEANPDLAKNPQGIKNIINYTKEVNKQKIGINNLVTQLARKNAGGDEIISAISKYTAENPVTPPGLGKTTPMPTNQNPNGPKDLNKPQGRVGDPVTYTSKSGKTVKYIGEE